MAGIAAIAGPRTAQTDECDVASRCRDDAGVVSPLASIAGLVRERRAGWKPEGEAVVDLLPTQQLVQLAVLGMGPHEQLSDIVCRRLLRAGEARAGEPIGGERRVE